MFVPAGCILCELYTGELLFPTHSNHEHLAMVERVAGDAHPVLTHTCNRSGSGSGHNVEHEERVADIHSTTIVPPFSETFLSQFPAHHIHKYFVDCVTTTSTPPVPAVAAAAAAGVGSEAATANVLRTNASPVMKKKISLEHLSATSRDRVEDLILPSDMFGFPSTPIVTTTVPFTGGVTGVRLADVSAAQRTHGAMDQEKEDQEKQKELESTALAHYLNIFNLLSDATVACAEGGMEDGGGAGVAVIDALFQDLRACSCGCQRSGRERSLTGSPGKNDFFTEMYGYTPPTSREGAAAATAPSKMVPEPQPACGAFRQHMHALVAAMLVPDPTCRISATCALRTCSLFQNGGGNDVTTMEVP